MSHSGDFLARDMPDPEACIRRVFVHIGGYYPLPVESNYRRFLREYNRSLSTWSLKGNFSEVTTTEAWAHWTINTSGTDWSSEVEHILFRWEDIINADRARTWFARLGHALITFVDFTASGALVGYFRHAWRYAGFFLYPYVLMALIFGLCLWLARTGLSTFGFLPPLLAAVALFFAVLYAFGTRLNLDHLLDDWNYAQKIVRNGDPELEKRLDQLAAKLNADPREIVIVGHSFGAIWGAKLIASMLNQRPDGPPIRFASVGASILKIGLNRNAHPLYRALETIATNPRIIWYDFTALNDVMNFYMVEPLKALNLAGTPATMHKVRFRLIVEPAYYQKLKYNFFNLHNQFISGNGMLADYDYFLLMCGPFPMETLFASRNGALDLFSSNGGLTNAGQALLAEKEPA